MLPLPDHQFALDSTPFKLDYLQSAKPNCVVYDIIYDPSKTRLLDQASREV